VPGYEATIWLGVMAPKGTPKDVIAFLNRSINKVISLPAVKEVWLTQGADPLVKDAGGIRCLSEEGHREVAEGGQGVRSQGAVNPHDSLQRTQRTAQAGDRR